MSRKLISLSVLALALAAPVFAQETTTTTPAPTAAPPQCEEQFTALDTDSSGTLSETEAPQVYAKSRIDNMTMPDTGYGRDEFLAACADNQFTRGEPEAGAPLEGANSFTEGQARDRATAWGVTGVSAMTKDDKGVWRGTGMVDGSNVSVAVDYKGNVVTAAQ
ncbi:MAG: hypothetical protein H7317_05015 [Pseudorhodobacter sp.]|nr:hypothetical protein [Pseudorhodobacter sp.]